MVLRRTASIAVMVGLFWSGCGGSSSDDSDGDGGTSASGAGGKGAAGSSGAAGKAGAGRGGSGTSGSGNGGEPGEAGAPNVDGGSAGSDEGGGGAPPDPSSCETPYAGPVGGPRASGPEPINATCANITDEQILARYNDNGAKVPQGSFWEPRGAYWVEPCSDSLAQTVADAEAENFGELEGQFETEWFYEASICTAAGRTLYRNLRCDYFDGVTLANGSGQTLPFLASLLWWQDNFNITGNALLGYSVQIGDATDWVEVCTIETVYGDFGLCDEITLFSTNHSVFFGGGVTLGEPQVVRTIQGDCH